MSVPTLSRTLLAIDAAATAEKIEASIRRTVLQLRRRGVVVALSGGIDSSVVGALAARALGSRRVLGLFMPEADSSPDSLRLGRALATAFNIPTVVEDITGTLTATGCYARRDAAIQSAIPEYHDGYRCKIVLPDIVTQGGYPLYRIVVRAPSGEERCLRLPLAAYLGIVAATNFKQRSRKMLEYYHADRLNYAVTGTPNLLEYDQGFFVKQGDGAADFKPIAHLYKSQVYQLAEHLGVPDAIRRRRPTTDTYPLEQSQEEFYFGLSLEQTDLCLYARDHGVPPDLVGEATGLTPEQVQGAFRMIDAKREATRYLHMAPILFDGNP